MSKVLHTKLSKVDSRQATDGLSLIQKIDGFLELRPIWAMVLPLGLFVLLQATLPLSTAIKIGEDEDFELAKAILALKGFRFYSDIWNDQPLLHTTVVTQILKHVSSSVLGPRLLTSVCSLILLGSLFLMIRRLHGVWPALFGALFVIGSPGFLELGSSAMLEIPALALALAALCAALHGRERRWPVLAGLLFALSLQTKFIGIIVLPLIACVFWSFSGSIEPPGQRWSRFHRSCSVFGMSLCLGFGVIVLLLGYETFWVQVKQAWASHFASTRTYEYGSPDDHPFDWMALLRNWDTTVFALVGLWALLRQKSFSTLESLPALWLGLVLLIFGTHRPWWSYYYVHIAVPLGYCAAVGLCAAFRATCSQKQLVPRIGLGLAICAIAVWVAARVSLEVDGVRSGRQTYSDLVLQEMARYKPFVRYMYADEPIYSFHAGIPMVPALGVVVMKRFWSGELTNARIRDEIVRMKPELILLRNPSQPAPFDDHLVDAYRLVFEDKTHRLFVAKTILPKAAW